MKKIALLTLLPLSAVLYSQVGINNDTPKATLDITAKTTDGSKPEGIIAPRLTGDQIKSADAQYGSDQRGAIVYALTAVSTASTKTANITGEGYYFFDGNIWQSVGSGTDTSIYKGSGSLSGNTVVTQNANTLSFTGSATNAFSVDGNTFSVDAANDRIGLGTSAPTAKLEINNTNSGLASVKVNNLKNQPSGANAAYVTVDNSTGEFYKGLQSEKSFYYQTYNINNVNQDWISDFDTKISTTDYTVIIVGSSFDQMLGVNMQNTSGNRFASQNVYAYKNTSTNTWRLTADFCRCNY